MLPQEAWTRLQTRACLATSRAAWSIGPAALAAPGRTELPTATSVAHGVGLGQPDDGDRPLEIDKVPKRVRGIGIVEVLPGLVSSQERKVA